jgi:serine/threonine protein kinase
VKNRKFGKYEVLERLGRGGMAEVYRAYHPNLDRFVAIKVLHSFLSDEGEFKVRFEKEAQNIAKLRHPNIVQVYDFDFDEDTDSYFMVMELIEGPTLKDYLYDNNEGVRKLPLAESVRIIRQASEALSYAHQRGMIHRDVKPANLMLDARENNRLVLTDFGIAKLLTGKQNTISGGLVGTPAYMSPEQGMGEIGDERSDLYSLGVIMYQLLTGELPYDAETPMALILQHMNDPVPSVRSIDPHLSPAVDKVLMRLMAKDPTQRYQGAQELISDLDLLEKAPARLDPTTLVLPKMILPPVKPEKEMSTARRIPVALLLLIMGLIVIGSGVFVLGANGGTFPFLSAFAASPTPTLEVTVAATASSTPPQATDIPASTSVSAGIGDLTATQTVVVNPTATPTATQTVRQLPTRTTTTTATPRATITPTETRTPTITATPTRTAAALSLTSTPIPTNTPTHTRTSLATMTPTATFTVQASNTPTPNLTETAAAERTATTEACRFEYAIIEQTPEDGMEGGFFPISEPYLREIRLLNTGSCAWARNSSLAWLGGEDFNAGPRIFIEEMVEPGAETTLIFEGTLPRRGKVDANGNVEPIVGTWQLLTPGQVKIGDPFEISIVVYDPG